MSCLKNKKLPAAGNFENGEFTLFMKKNLKIAWISKSVDSVVFRIIEQSHRNDDFSNLLETEPNEYLCPDTKLRIISCSMPEWDTIGKILFVRGSDRRHDNDEMLVSVKEFEKIEKAVENYNREHNGFEPLKIDCLQDDLFIIE